MIVPTALAARILCSKDEIRPGRQPLKDLGQHIDRIAWVGKDRGLRQITRFAETFWRLVRKLDTHGIDSLHRTQRLQGG